MVEPSALALVTAKDVTPFANGTGRSSRCAVVVPASTFASSAVPGPATSVSGANAPNASTGPVLLITGGAVMRTVAPAADMIEFAAPVTVAFVPSVCTATARRSTVGAG